MLMFCLLDRTIQICVSCFSAVQIWFFEYNSFLLTTGCATWHLVANNSEDLIIRIVALHKDCLGYKKLQYSGKGHTEVFKENLSVSLSVLRPYSTHCNKSVCMAVVPEGSLFWSWLTKNPANSLLKTTWLRAWITGTMSCGLMSLR